MMGQTADSRRMSTLGDMDAEKARVLQEKRDKEAEERIAVDHYGAWLSAKCVAMDDLRREEALAELKAERGGITLTQYSRGTLKEHQARYKQNKAAVDNYAIRAEAVRILAVEAAVAQLRAEALQKKTELLPAVPQLAVTTTEASMSTADGQTASKKAILCPDCESQVGTTDKHCRECGGVVNRTKEELLNELNALLPRPTEAEGYKYEKFVKMVAGCRKKGIVLYSYWDYDGLEKIWDLVGLRKANDRFETVLGGNSYPTEENWFWMCEEDKLGIILVNKVTPSRTFAASRQIDGGYRKGGNYTDPYSHVSFMWDQTLYESQQKQWMTTPPKGWIPPSERLAAGKKTTPK